MSATMFYIFAYGSLMFSPELPKRVAYRALGSVEGHHRAFNKRSSPRACRPEHRLRPDLEPVVPYRFRGPASLALGTRPGGTLHGVLLGYAEEDRAELFTRLDAREGVWHDQPFQTWSYLPTRVPVTTEDGTFEATCWLSNPQGDWHEADLTEEEVVQILLHATPTAVTEYARGIDYLLRTWRAVNELGLEAPALNQLVERLDPAIRARLDAPRAVSDDATGRPRS
jgi:cation transport regulator ChaC